MQHSWRITPQLRSDVTVRPVQHKRTKKGAWTAGRAIQPDELLAADPALKHPLDDQVAAMLKGSRYYGNGFVDRDVVVPLMRLLARHPRVFLADSQRPLAIQEGVLGVGLFEQPGEDAPLLLPTLDGDALDPEQLTADGRMAPLVLDHEKSRLSLIDPSPEALAAVKLCARYSRHVAADGLAELVNRLSALEPSVPVRLPPALKGEQIPRCAGWSCGSPGRRRVRWRSG